jgi:hypothetical protein
MSLTEILGLSSKQSEFSAFSLRDFYLFAIEGRYSEISGKIMISAMATMSMITKGILAL